MMPASEWQMPAMERRFQPRAEVEIEAQYRLSERGLWLPALIQNLSGGGSAALIDDGLALGTALAGLRFLVPDEVGDSDWPLVVLAQVVRCVPAPEAPRPFLARLQFLYPPPREVETLRRFVHLRLHGPAADRIPIEIPPYEIAAGSSAENRLARRLDTVRREGAALERDLTALGSQAERASGALDKRIAALQDVLYTAVATEERLRAEIRRLGDGQPSAETQPARGDTRHEALAADLERVERERAELARDTSRLRHQLEVSARDREAAVTETQRLETELASVSADVEALRREKRDRWNGVSPADRPLPLPKPVTRDPRWRVEMVSLATGLILGAMAILGWQRFVQARPEDAGVALAEPLSEPLDPEPDAVATPSDPLPVGASTEPARSSPPARASRPPAARPATEPAAEPPPAPEATAAPPATALIAEPPPIVAARTEAPPEEPVGDDVAQSPPSGEDVEAAADEPVAGGRSEPEEEEEEAGRAADTDMLAGTLQAWAAAWTDRRPEDYLALYDERFEPPAGLSRPAWEAERRALVQETTWTLLRVNRMRHREFDGAKVVVDINLVCESESASAQATNTFELGWTGETWRILRELRDAGCRLPGPGTSSAG